VVRSSLGTFQPPPLPTIREPLCPGSDEKQPDAGELLYELAFEGFCKPRPTGQAGFSSTPLRGRHGQREARVLRSVRDLLEGERRRRTGGGIRGRGELPLEDRHRHRTLIDVQRSLAKGIASLAQGVSGQPRQSLIFRFGQIDVGDGLGPTRRLAVLRPE